MAWAALLIGVKEDVALVALCFGLYVAAVHRRPIGLALAVAAAVAFGLLVWIVIPGWIQTPYFALFNRWLHLGRTPVELILSPVLQPAAFFGTLLQPERLGYLAMLVAPLACLPLLAPDVLAVGVFPLASNLLSSTEGQYTIRAHYTAALTAVLIAATVVGGRRAAAWLGRLDVSDRCVLAGLAATTLVASLAFSPMPWSRDAFARKQFWTASPAMACRGSPVVPPEASVSAANHLGAHFALRRTLRLFPDGWETADIVLVDVGGRTMSGPRHIPTLSAAPPRPRGDEEAARGRRRPGRLRPRSAIVGVRRQADRPSRRIGDRSRRGEPDPGGRARGAGRPRTPGDAAGPVHLDGRRGDGPEPRASRRAWPPPAAAL